MTIQNQLVACISSFWFMKCETRSTELCWMLTTLLFCKIIDCLFVASNEMLLLDKNQHFDSFLKIMTHLTGIIICNWVSTPHKNYLTIKCLWFNTHFTMVSAHFIDYLCCQGCIKIICASQGSKFFFWLQGLFWTNSTKNSPIVYILPLTNIF